MAGARRWAIPLARILRFAGYDVTTEYYINDAGRQMRLLGLSIWLRAKELAGIAVEWPEDYYRGSYIIDIAREMMDKDPGLTSLSDAEGQDRCFAYGMQTILDGIKEDLREFRVEHQCGSPSVLLWSAELLKKPLSA